MIPTESPIFPLGRLCVKQIRDFSHKKHLVKDLYLETHKLLSVIGGKYV